MAQRQPLLNVGGYLAVDVLHGVHKYTFTYQPRSFYIGLAITPGRQRDHRRSCCSKSCALSRATPARALARLPGSPAPGSGPAGELVAGRTSR